MKIKYLYNFIKIMMILYYISLIIVTIIFVILYTSKKSESIPKGTIMIYKGDPNNIPSGWNFCDGNNNTPDLRGKIILGFNPEENKDANRVSNQLDLSGGSEKSPTSGGGGGGGGGNTYYIDVLKSGNLFRANTTEQTKTLLQNMPPYYVLQYIMKK